MSHPDVPDWNDRYLDRVADRLIANYDLEKDRTIRGERFALYARMNIHNQKEFFHPALSYGHHESDEHLFVRRADGVSVADLERLAELAHDLADEWIEADEEHFSTEFTFAVVVPDIPEGVRSFVAGFSDRSLLKYGYYGHYEIDLVVVAPDREECVASPEADIGDAFVLWESTEDEKPGLFGLIARQLRI